VINLLMDGGIYLYLTPDFSPTSDLPPSVCDGQGDQSTMVLNKN
jgi:hypothetical protein